MKNIFSFLFYCWNSWKLWQKLIILSVVMNIVSAFVSQPWNYYLGIAAISIIAGMFLVWWVNDMLIPKWKDWKAHRNELLTTIKESHK